MINGSPRRETHLERKDYHAFGIVDEDRIAFETVHDGGNRLID